MSLTVSARLTNPSIMRISESLAQTISPGITQILVIVLDIWGICNTEYNKCDVTLSVSENRYPRIMHMYEMILEISCKRSGPRNKGPSDKYQITQPKTLTFVWCNSLNFKAKITGPWILSHIDQHYYGVTSNVCITALKISFSGPGVLGSQILRLYLFLFLRNWAKHNRWILFLC